jgi:hypothetical protein
MDGSIGGRHTGGRIPPASCPDPPRCTSLGANLTDPTTWPTL